MLKKINFRLAEVKEFVEGVRREEERRLREEEEEKRRDIGSRKIQV